MKCICVSKIGLAFASGEAVFIKFCYQNYEQADQFSLRIMRYLGL